MSLKRSGLNTLAYLGVEPLTPPNLVVQFTAPTVNDSNFNVGDIWLEGQLNANGVFDTIIAGWILTILAGSSSATWTQFYPVSGSGASIFPTNSGTAVQQAGIINIFGGNHITTSGAGNTITIATDGLVADTFVTDAGVAIPAANQLVVHGGNVVNTTATAHSVLTNLDNGTDGQLLIGGGANPAWASVTSSGGTIAIGVGPNSLNLEAGGGAVAHIYQTDVGSASPIAGNINYFGSINLNTSGAVNTITVNLDDNVLINQSLTTGTTVTAGTGLIVNSGGIDSIGTTTLHSLTAGVMQTDAGGVVSSTNGTNGQLLIGGGAAPAWNNITSSGGTIAITNGANTINLETAGGGGGFGTGPAFLAILTNSDPLGNLGATQALIEKFDQTNSFFPGDGAGSPAVFTAPTTGYYMLNFFGEFMSSSEAMIITFSIVTTARTYTIKKILTGSTDGGPNYMELTVIADMSAGDTATYVTSGSGTTVRYFPFQAALTPYAYGTWVSGAKIA